MAVVQKFRQCCTRTDTAYTMTGGRKVVICNCNSGRFQQSKLIQLLIGCSWHIYLVPDEKKINKFSLIFILVDPKPPWPLIQHTLRYRPVKSIYWASLLARPIWSLSRVDKDLITKVAHLALIYIGSPERTGLIRLWYQDGTPWKVSQSQVLGHLQ